MKRYNPPEAPNVTFLCPESLYEPSEIFHMLRDESGPWGFDTETTTYRRHHHTYAVCGFSIARGNTAAYIPLMHADGWCCDFFDAGYWLRSMLQQFLESSDVGASGRWFMFNAKFDIHGLDRLVGFGDIDEWSPGRNVVDTQILAYLHDSYYAGKGLKELCSGPYGPDGKRRKAPVGEWVANFKEEVSLSRGAHRLTVDQIWKYAAADAWMTLRLGERLLPLHKENPLLRVEHDFLWVVYAMENGGAGIDQDALKKSSAACSAAAARKLKSVRAIFGDDFNPASPQHVAEAMAARGITSFKCSKKTGNPSWDKHVLEAMAPEHPELKLLLEYSRLQKLKSAFFDGLRKMTRFRTSRVHASYKTNVETGRMACSAPNLQQTPRPDETKDPMLARVRGVFVPDPGHVLLCPDFDQVELRLAAWYSKEPSLLDAARSGHDLHLATACVVNGLEYADAAERLAGGDKAVKAARSASKNVNFALLYGATEHKLAGDLKVPLDTARDLVQQDRERRPVLHAWIDSVHAAVRTKGYVTDWYGRVRHFRHAIHERQEWRLSRVYRQAVNFMCQGGSATVTKLSALRVAKLISPYEARLVNIVHDELIISCPADHVAELAPRIVAAMEDFHELDGLITAGMEVAPVRWSEKVSLKEYLDGPKQSS